MAPTPADGIMVPGGGAVAVTTHDAGASAMQVTTVGLDLAKSVFQVHAVDADGRVIIRKALRHVQGICPGRAALGGRDVS